MNKIVQLLAAFAVIVACVDAHASMLKPQSRGHFLRDFEGRNEWCDNALPGFWDKLDASERRLNGTNIRNTTCGICGPIYNGEPNKFHQVWKNGPQKFVKLSSYEDNSPIYTGDIVASYNPGQTIDTTIHVGALHKGGVHTFKICRASLGQDPTQECLDANALKFSTGNKVEDLKDGTKNNYEYKIKLPEGLTCDHCVLQWQWITAGSPGQIYHSCADVRIV